LFVGVHFHMPSIIHTHSIVCRLSPKISLRPKQRNWPMLFCLLRCGEKRLACLPMSTGRRETHRPSQGTH
jgi:hypothetical protein